MITRYCKNHCKRICIYNPQEIDMIYHVCLFIVSMEPKLLSHITVDYLFELDSQSKKVGNPFSLSLRLKEPNVHPLFFDLLSKKKWNIRRICPLPPKSTIFHQGSYHTNKRPLLLYPTTLSHVVQNKRQNATPLPTLSHPSLICQKGASDKQSDS